MEMEPDEVMKVLLIDVDSEMPNLALMQTSTYYKSKGHDVGFRIGDPDKVFISCIFTKNRALALGRAKLYPESEIHLGGSGINYGWLPEPMQKVQMGYATDNTIDQSYKMDFKTRQLGELDRIRQRKKPEKEPPKDISGVDIFG